MSKINPTNDGIKSHHSVSPDSDNTEKSSSKKGNWIGRAIARLTHGGSVSKKTPDSNSTDATTDKKPLQQREVKSSNSRNFLQRRKLITAETKKSKEIAGLKAKLPDLKKTDYHWANSYFTDMGNITNIPELIQEGQEKYGNDRYGFHTWVKSIGEEKYGGNFREVDMTAPVNRLEYVELSLKPVAEEIFNAKGLPKDSGRIEAIIDDFLPNIKGQEPDIYGKTSGMNPEGFSTFVQDRLDKEAAPAINKTKEADSVEKAGGFNISDNIMVLPGNICNLQEKGVNPDAIVNAANPQLIQGGGVCGQIFEAAENKGKLAKACKNLAGNESSVGKAVVTDSYKLKKTGIRKIIHAIAPNTNLPPYQDNTALTENDLSKTYKALLTQAKKHKLETVAVPVLGTGVYGIDKELAINTAVKATKQFHNDNDSKPTVYFVIYDKATDYSEFIKKFEAHKS